LWFNYNLVEGNFWKKELPVPILLVSVFLYLFACNINL
jgi:hypothetical protein